MATRGRKRAHINEFEKLLLQDLKEWGDVTKADIHALVEEYGKKLKKQVSKDSPKRTGEYRKSWRIKHEIVDDAKYKSVIHNKEHYRLTHLLEHGHAKRNGGRTKAYPHLLKTEEKINKEFVEAVARLFGK